ncbi:hypothetical protein KKH3_34410 [Pectobacterium actinidiae]|nr:hypothetical protein KKH3_34410 [Pectobacterium actinidiae]
MQACSDPFFPPSAFHHQSGSYRCMLVKNKITVIFDELISD